MSVLVILSPTASKFFFYCGILAEEHDFSVGYHYYMVLNLSLVSVLTVTI